jgi:hypothetical protein
VIKYFCDRCGEEFSSAGLQLAVFARDKYGSPLLHGGYKHLCERCKQKFLYIKDKLEYSEKFFELSDEDIDLLYYNFKIGDEVITSEGLIGVITDICDCDKCKERGFYEPQVKTTFGDSGIYITDTEKNSGFPSFYKIGDHVFGNIDLDYIIGRIDYTERELIFLEQQKEILMELTKENESC